MLNFMACWLATNWQWVWEFPLLGGLAVLRFIIGRLFIKPPVIKIEGRLSVDFHPSRLTWRVDVYNEKVTGWRRIFFYDRHPLKDCWIEADFVIDDEIPSIGPEEGSRLYPAEVRLPNPRSIDDSLDGSEEVSVIGSRFHDNRRTLGIRVVHQYVNPVFGEFIGWLRYIQARYNLRLFLLFYKPRKILHEALLNLFQVVVDFLIIVFFPDINEGITDHGRYDLLVKVREGLSNLLFRLSGLFENIL